MAAFGVINLAVVGEPEAAMRIKHDIVRATQAATMVAGLIKYLDLTGVDIDPFNPPTLIILRNAMRRKKAIGFHILKPAVVAAI